ncbi:aerial mycelium formation protein [Saccharomonospora sp.]|uniref:RsiG family protein n=1 Tax=Saccharomonospora sp. TaxID=33913 RepID=UPI002629D7B0|nr:aerial mycelium formation protein [Saccharomonospora sp.]
MIEVRPGGRRRIDRVLAADYTRDLDRMTMATLRERRNEAAQEETDLSYLRRLLHARIDIVKAEQQSRASGTRGRVVEQLTTILADNALGPATGSGRYQKLEPSRAGEYRRRAEALVGNADLSDVTSLSDEKLAEALESYREQERSVSKRRREVQAVVDSFNAEIARRYAQGTASVDELLNSERRQGEPGGENGTT